MSEENAGASRPSALGGPENPQKVRALAGVTRGGPRFLAWVALVVTAFSLFLPLSASGIWDPPEREVAELARRIALNLLGGHQLAVEGADNEVPTRSELGRGELPFTSIAVGFRVFGLHEWAGRLPLAIWGAIGVAATYLLVSRLSDRQTGCFAVLVLTTMPLYFLHARTMLGDIVTMAGLALALAGLGLAVFERGPSATLGARCLALGLGTVGVLCAVLSRGVLVGIAVPAFSVGISWLFLRVARVTSRDGFGDVVGALSLLVGLCAAFAACRALVRAPDSAGPFSLLLGSVINRPHVLPTFDSVLLQLGHALFPWSALIPIAWGSLLGAPLIESEPEREREAALRLLCLALPISAFLAYGISAPVLGNMPFAAVSALAIAVALFVRDFERGEKASRGPALVACALAILLLADFKNFPDKALSAFSVADSHFPDSFRGTAERVLEAGTLIFCAAFFFSWQERSSHEDPRFDPREYRAWPRVLHELWAGNLQFALLVAEAACVGLAILGVLGDHLSGFARLAALAATPRSAALIAACVLPLLVFVPSLLTLVRDAFRTLFDPELSRLLGAGAALRPLGSGLSRAQAGLFAGTAFGLYLSLGYYPLLAAQISPKQVFDAYRREAGPADALGILGSGAGSATYYAGRNVPSFDTPARAFEWLSASHDRRWLVIPGNDLGTINALYRAEQHPPRNLPVFDAGSSENLLVSNRLGSAHNDNPLGRYVLDDAPRPGHALDANLGDKLDVLGWDTLDPDGRVVAAVEPGRRYVFVIYFRVVQPISGSWETFIHIDGFQRRFNGDHPILAGKYPLNLWRVGDFIADRSEFELEPNFGAGRYQVYFGLYNGNRRLEVRRGPAQENRLQAGFLDVL